MGIPPSIEAELELKSGGRACSFPFSRAETSIVLPPLGVAAPGPRAFEHRPSWFCSVRGACCGPSQQPPSFCEPIPITNLFLRVQVSPLVLFLWSTLTETQANKKSCSKCLGQGPRDLPPRARGQTPHHTHGSSRVASSPHSNPRRRPLSVVMAPRMEDKGVSC